MRKLFLAAAVMLALGGCKDYGRCLASHQESYTETITYVVGGVMIGQIWVPFYSSYDVPAVRTVCDRWEYPNGR